MHLGMENASSEVHASSEINTHLRRENADNIGHRCGDRGLQCNKFEHVSPFNYPN